MLHNKTYMTAKNMLFRFLYKKAKIIVDFISSENNDDFERNGESLFLKYCITDATIVFDIGANVGDYSKIITSTQPNISLHCFEPSPITFSILSNNIITKNVKLNNVGVGSSDGSMDLFTFGDGSKINSLYKRAGLENGWGIQSQRHSEKVKIITLDNYAAVNNITNISFVKVDVEGHELEVLKGAQLLLDNDQIEALQFEYGGTNIDSRVLLKDIFDFVSILNYRLYKITPDGLAYQSRYDQRLENFQYKNFTLINNNIQDKFSNIILK